MSGFRSGMESESVTQNYKRKEAEKELRPKVLKEITREEHPSKIIANLRKAGGNINVLLSEYYHLEAGFHEQKLFEIEDFLSRSENEDYLAQWRKLTRRSLHVRMEIARHRALDSLSTFGRTSGTPASLISWIKLVLGDEFIGPFTAQKLIAQSKYGPKALKSDSDDDEDDPIHNDKDVLDQLLPEEAAS